MLKTRDWDHTLTLSTHPMQRYPSRSFGTHRVLLYVFAILITSTFRVCYAQNDELEDFIKSKEKAVITVSNALGKALEKGAWCKAADSCSDEDSCGLHGCSGTFGDDFRCSPNISRESCDGGSGEKVCKAGYNSQGTLLNMEKATVRTPEEAVTSNGDNQSIVITEKNMRRDICALNRINGQIVAAYNDNNLTAWLYAGTANRAFIDFPGKAICRGSGDDSIQDCGYDPTARPWYITAASGPRDIVFLFDTTSLTVTDSKLLNALVTALNTLDSRDRVAIVAFDGLSNYTLADNVSLQNGTPEVVEDLKERLLGLTSASGFPNVALALETAFSILKRAKEENISSNCSRYIVTLTGNPDNCFSSCTNRNRCSCVQQVTTFLKAKQDSQDPVTIVTFTEPDSGLNEIGQGHLERLAKTMVCSSESSGIWSGVTDRSESLLSTFYQITATSLYEEEPKVFSSQLYEDNDGLGKMFTLAVPVYERNERRLLGVAGLDVTLDEVIQVVGDKKSAETEISRRGDSSRECPKKERNDGCALQNLRSQSNSARCAPFYAADVTCFTFGQDTYYRNRTVVTFEEALGLCSKLASGSLATVDTAHKNEFLSGAFDMDGSWIGLRAPHGSNLSWVANGDSSSSTFDFGFSFDGNEVAKLVQDNSNADACVTADGRGTEDNWNILQCDQLRPFICQVSPGITKSICTKTEDGTTNNNVNPIGCGRTSGGTFGSQLECSEEQDKEIESADPLCKQQGHDYTEFDRFCCGGQADVDRQNNISPSPSPSPTLLISQNENSLGSGAIAGTTVGVIVLVIAIVSTIVFGKRRKLRSSTYDSDSNVPSSVMKADNTDRPVSKQKSTSTKNDDELRPPGDADMEPDQRISFDEPFSNAEVTPLDGNKKLPPVVVNEGQTESTDWRV